VRIGRVDRIGFVTRSYTDFDDSDFRYVYVICDLDERYLGKYSEADLKRITQQEVKDGMRVRPTTQGLTGQLFLEVDYLNPLHNPPLPIDWEPEYIYIPSAPSTLSMVESAITSISTTLKDINGSDISSTVRELRLAAETVRTFLEKAKVGKLSQQVGANLEESRKFIHRINQLIAAPEAETLIPDASRTMAEVRGLLEQSRPDIVAGIRDIRRTAADFSKVAAQFEAYFNSAEGRQALEKIGPILENANQASGDFRRSAAKMDMLATRVNDMVAGQQLNIQAVMENLRLLLENLKDLSDEARRYPSGVLFGNPPEKVQSEEK
jgi:paraquat-inducible protein B